MKPDDLRALREMSRELDSTNSAFRCVVSVMMLREGWDVRNVTTIAPLRPYSAKSGILPEQTLGRGLRRMFSPEQNIIETVTVVHHPAFRKLYEDELAQEGLDIAVLPIREMIKQTVTIFVDREKKAIDNLEIELPQISDAIATTAELKELTFDEIKKYCIQRFQPLPIGKKKAGPIEYKERHLFTDEVVSRMQLDAGLLSNAWSAASYFAKMLGRACHLSHPSASLQALIEDFLSKVLFEREVALYSGEVDHRMRDIDVLEHVRATFTPLILQKIVQKHDRKRGSIATKISEWKPFQATSTEKRPAVQAQRTMFNLVPCENDFEQEFADFCDYAADVAAFAKNAGPQKLMIDYLRPDGHRAFYVPDYFIRLKNGNYVLVELKGRVDPLVPVKAMAANEWCKAAAKGKATWQYLYVPYQLFQDSAAASIEELVRACVPSLKDLIGEAKTGQLALPLEEATAEAQAEELFVRVMRQAGITNVPKSIEDVMRQSIQVLDHAVRSKMPDLAHAFQPLLRPLDDYALHILTKQLNPSITSRMREHDYFEPYITGVPPRERGLLEKNQRYLQQNLVYGRSIQKLGTLLFCLDYAQKGGAAAPGVWRDVQKQFSGKAMGALYAELRQVNDFRNTRVAHIEKKLDSADEAWKALIEWLRCINKMVAIAS